MRIVCKTMLGAMLVNDQDAYIGPSLIKYGDFSRGEVQLFSELVKPGMTVIDVGANIGTHTLLFAHLVGRQGRVHAFEPQRLIHQMLCANMAINNIDNVFCHQNAIGAEDAVIKIHSLDPNTPTNFGGISLEDLKQDQGEPVRVQPLTFPCHFMKVDVEGMESEVLRGAAAMIKEYQPILYVENDRPDKSPELLETIDALGYEAFWHITPLYAPDNTNGDPENIFGSTASMNLLCLPKGDTRVEHQLDRALVDHRQYLAQQRAL